MKIKIPDTWRGISTKEAYERVLARDDNEDQKTVQPVLVPANINLQEYLQIPNTNFIIAEYEPDWTKNFDYETSHKRVLQKGLQIPPPSLFMPHFVNVINAYHNRSSLCDASGAKVTGQRLENLYKHLTNGSYNGNAWSWLNAKFVPETGFKGKDLETVIGLSSNGNLVTEKEPLEKCIWGDCFVDLEFNKQGLATKKSKDRSYKQGENINFWYPRKNSFVRFGAFSDWAYLNCDGSPGNSYPALGVFASFQRS